MKQIEWTIFEGEEIIYIGTCDVEGEL